MWLFDLSRQDWTSVYFLPVLAPPGEELLSSADFGKSLPWTPGSPASHCGPGRISVKKKRSAIVWPQRQKVQQFCNFCCILWVAEASSRPTTNVHCNLPPPPLCSAYCWSFAAYWRSSRINTWQHYSSNLSSIQESVCLPAIHLWVAERKVPTSKTKSIVFQLTSSEVVIHRNSFLSINPSKLTSNNLREKHLWFILLVSMNIATEFHLLWTDLNAVTVTLCQYWSLSLSKELNWSPMFSCLICRMKSFFLTWE